MQIRPRYSLLTFMLVVAAIAAGYKYYRGPHRVVFPNFYEDAWKNYPAEWQLWHDLKLANNPISIHGHDVQQECEYIQEPQKKRILTVSETWQTPRYLCLGEIEGYPDRIPEIRPSDVPLTIEGAAQLRRGSRQHVVSVERLLCWVGGDATHYPWGLPFRHWSNSTDLYLSEAIPDEQLHPFYFLTESGRVYQLRTLKRSPAEPDEPEHCFDPVEWSAIADEAIKARLQEYQRLLAKP
jgi:hypothetical protein